jgi:GH25 family lysozyme M1 (1,4-beta-N-acetylmuramidase)
MDLTSITIGLDVWEGSLEINEPVVLSNGCEFLFIRLNDINGGHHKDEGFDKQWAEAVNFVRVPYFVYNPWVTGQSNFAWMAANLPAGVKTVAIDVEVKKTEYGAKIYAAEVKTFVDLCKSAGFSVIIYTGAWFRAYLSYWPTDVEYWFARYPYSLYPVKTTAITWDELKDLLRNTSWYPGDPKAIPGPCSLWQCSGDRFILPGTSRVTDINVFSGTPQDMIARYKLPDTQVPARLRGQLTLEQRVERLEQALQLAGIPLQVQV